ncbi:MAG TPA: hypothetical protein PLW14_06385 [Chlorobiota bacterium]|nr:hypothetical protein [Chlorobiota bacterium]
MKPVHTLAIVLVSILATACSTTEPANQEAQRMTMKDLSQTPAYAWFPAEQSVYTPNTDMVRKVSEEYDPATEKVYIFVKPACSCKGTMKLFPQIVKTMEAAGIDMNHVEIWSMRSESDTHPYMSTMAISKLPEVFITSGGSVKAHITVAEFNEMNADSLIATAVSR